MFNMFLNALEAMATNRNLWEAYLKRSYKNDIEIYPETTDEKQKSCFALRDSKAYDSHIEYVVSKVLRNMIAHHSKPYSEMIYDDNYRRKFIVTREDLLLLGSPNASAKKHITNSRQDYYDIVDVITKAFEITDEINTFMLNLMVQKGWPSFISAQYTVREHIGIDWQGAYLVWENLKYPENHLLRLSQIDISKHAMNVICSIAAQSLMCSSKHKRNIQDNNV